MLTHGGESLRTNTLANESVKLINCNDKLKIIEKNVEKTNLVDDICVSERAWDQKQAKRDEFPTDKEKPTPVTLENVRGSKKDCKIKYDNLRILLDSGCSDFIAIKKYGKKNQQEVKTRKFTTGSGTLKTKYEANIKFTLPVEVPPHRK